MQGKLNNDITIKRIFAFRVFRNKGYAILLILLFTLTFPSAYALQADTLSAIQADSVASTSNLNSDTFIIKGDIPVIDSSKLVYHSPSKASILSAVFPGLGQVYNKKYWKLPIIYAGIGVCIYSIKFADDRYKKFNTAYIKRYNNDANARDEYWDRREYITLTTLGEHRDFYRRNRDLTVIILVGVYALNIIDATVDAYLFDYDVSPDLSIHFAPIINNSGDNTNFALSCSIRF